MWLKCKYVQVIKKVFIPSQKVFLGRADIVGYKISDSRRIKEYRYGKDQVRQKRNGSLREQSESDRTFSVGADLNCKLEIFGAIHTEG